MKPKRISANIPRELLNEACNISQLSQTEAIIAGLRELILADKRERLVALRGKINIKLNLDQYRNRIRL